MLERETKQEKESPFLDPARIMRAAKIHEGMKVADFGSSAGFFTRAAAHAVGRGGEVWAIDHNPDLLKRTKALAAAEGQDNVELVVGSVEHRDGSHLPDGAMDAVIAANVASSAKQKESLVEEIWRVLKSGGRAVIVDWKGSFGGMGPGTSDVLAENAARELFEKGGFTFVETIPAGGYHWGFVVRKK